MPELLGGAEASQNGFGERMPAKLIPRSAMLHQPFMNRMPGQLSVLHGPHGGSSTPRADAVSPSVNARQTRFEIRIHVDKSLFGFEFQPGSESGFLLSDGLHHLVCGEKEFRSRDRLRRGTSRNIRRP